MKKENVKGIKPIPEIQLHKSLTQEYFRKQKLLKDLEELEKGYLGLLEKAKKDRKKIQEYINDLEKSVERIQKDIKTFKPQLEVES